MFDLNKYNKLVSQYDEIIKDLISMDDYRVDYNESLIKKYVIDKKLLDKFPDLIIKYKEGYDYEGHWEQLILFKIEGIENKPDEFKESFYNMLEEVDKDLNKLLVSQYNYCMGVNVLNFTLFEDGYKKIF